MALTPKYANFDLATGNNDGTTEADAWQSPGVVSLSAGDHLFVKQTASRYAASGIWTISVSPTTDAPVIVEGYETTPGDGGMFLMDRGVSVPANVPLLNFDIEGSTSENLFASGANGVFVNCIFTGVNYMTTADSQGHSFIGCKFVYTSTAMTSPAIFNSACHFYGCWFEGAGSAANGLVSVDTFCTFEHCVFIADKSAGTAIGIRSESPNDQIVVRNCSFYNLTRCVDSASTGGGPGTTGGIYSTLCAVQSCTYFYLAPADGNNTNIQVHGLLHDGGFTEIFEDGATPAREWTLTDEQDNAAAIFTNAAGGDFSLADYTSPGNSVYGPFRLYYGAIGPDAAGGGGNGNRCIIG